LTGADADAEDAVELRRDVSWAALVATPSANISKAAITIRTMNNLLSAAGRRIHA
jgi:hypothetical protein